MNTLSSYIDTPAKLSGALRVLGGSPPGYGRALVVRYPWAGWGADTYAHRSLYNGGDIDVTTEPTPSRLARAGHVLTVANSNRRVFEVGFPFKNRLKPWRTWTTEQITHPWWDSAGRPHPFDNGTNFPSPLPMSSTSVWCYYTEHPPGTTPNGLPYRWLGVARNALPMDLPDLSGGVEWDERELYARGAWQHDGPPTRQYINRRKCTRVLVYKDVSVNSAMDGFDNFTASEPDYIGRQMPNNGTPGDLRFKPWGWTDYTIPEWSRRTGKAEQYWPLHYNDHYFTPYDPAPAGTSMGGEPPDPVDGDDIATLSNDMIWAGFFYGGRPWSAPWDSGWKSGLEALVNTEIGPEAKTFDLVIEAVFMEYIITEANIESAHDDGYLRPEGYTLVEKGYAGAYGRMFAIY